MANLISPGDWAKFFKAVSTDAKDTFYQKQIIWKRLKSTMDPNGEDNNDNGYTDTILEVQLNYNWMRSWPVNFRTESGDLDRQSVQVMLIKDYLKSNNWLDVNGLFIYDPSNDRFVIDGLWYQPMGDTAVSQYQNDDILFSIILKRDEGKTGDIR